MKLKIDYIQQDKKAGISSDQQDCFSWDSICRFLQDRCPSSEICGGNITLSWYEFLTAKIEFASLCKNVCHADLELTIAAQEQLSGLIGKGYHSAIRQTPVNEEVLLHKLKDVGFMRLLTAEQLRNVCKLAALPAGADFSVPGAGKTTEALAYFFYHAEPSSHLLVVAPKNAFSSWDEQLEACMGKSYGSFVRLTGGETVIQEKLSTSPRFAIISYTQFPIVSDLIANYLTNQRVMLFLDESHRIKSGAHGISANAIISISHLPHKKLILSGTPMPQSEADLNPQLSFLYPDISLVDRQVTELIQPIYVRTTKSELHLPEAKVQYLSFQLQPRQSYFYQMLKSEAFRQASGMPITSKRYLRRLGRSIIKLIQFASNPALLIHDANYAFSQNFSELLLEEDSPKIEYACNRARELASQGQKCIIWSSFVRNVELISYRLADLGADYIHGGVDAGDELESDTREGKLKRFREDKNAFVLVANPAAASEGISLHTVCHTAIYVDRSFNAAQYLQSVDRIHRLGLDEGIDTNIEILECVQTVDQVIGTRLSEKINRMANVLNDPSLRIEYDPYFLENDIQAGGIDQSDVKEILKHLGGDPDD